MKHQGARASVDLSLVINIHREGRLIHPTLRDLAASCREVVERGRTVEVILVLDRGDGATLAYLDEFVDRIFEGLPVFRLSVQNGDLGLSRNSGVAFARGRFIAFSDADNLYSRNWLPDALERLIAGGRREILHPAILLNFEAKNVIWRLMSSEDPSFDPRGMAEHNYWDAVCMAPRAAFEEFPYAPSSAGPGFGPEDWHWNCETLAGGWQHHPVPRTAMFYRVKHAGSLALHHEATGALLAPTRLLFSAAAVAGVRTGALRSDRGAGTLPGQPLGSTRRRFDPLRSAVLRSARSAARVASRALVRAARIHPRVDDFQLRMRPIVADLLAPPRRDVILRHDGEAGEGDFPAWLIDAWKTAHLTEPALFPQAERMSTIIRWLPEPGDYTSAYWKLLESFRFGTGLADYVFLVPWMSTGGASVVVLNYLRAIREHDPDARIVVLSTVDRWSPLRSDSDLTRFVRVPAEFFRLPETQQAHLLGTALVQVGPRVVHLVNSPTGFAAFERYARPLAARSRLYLSIFTLDETPEGERNHYVLSGIRRYIDDLTGVFVDNAPLRDSLIEMFALPAEKFFLHYQPPPSGVIESSSRVRAADRERRRLRVLWAGRLDRQKRPDLLAAISEAARSRGIPVEFAAAGAGVLESGRDAAALLRKAGVDCIGEYRETVGSIRGSFDVLLLTSQWEGLPLTLLDAALHDLTIVASAVGGVPDFVEHGRTGYLCARYDDVEGYLQVLELLANDRTRLLATRASAKELANTRHSWENFAAAVAASARYLD